MGEIAIGLVCVWVGYQLGWRDAHVCVARECERLGKFFVGKTVYECTAIQSKPSVPATKEES